MSEGSRQKYRHVLPGEPLLAHLPGQFNKVGAHALGKVAEPDQRGRHARLHPGILLELRLQSLRVEATGPGVGRPNEGSGGPIIEPEVVDINVRPVLPERLH